MGSRRNRSSLSLVRKCDSPKSPITRAQLTKIEPNVNTSPSNSSVDARKVCNDGSPLLLDNDSLPIPMSQDTNNLLTGVSWEWNSPKRTIATACKQRPRPLLLSNVLSNNNLKRSRTQKKSDELTGFYKFQSELKLLQKRTESPNSCEEEDCFEIETDSATSRIPSSPGCENMFISFSLPNEANCPLSEQSRNDPPQQTEEENFRSQSDSFNDSCFDSLLLQASQIVENKGLSTAREPPETTKVDARNVIEKPPGKRRSLVKSLTSDNLNSIQDDLFNDSELDDYLIEASQMIEQKILEVNSVPKSSNSSSTKTVPFTRHKSMPESPRHKPVPNSIHSHNSTKQTTGNNFSVNSSSSNAKPTIHKDQYIPSDDLKLGTSKCKIINCYIMLNNTFSSGMHLIFNIA
ncbi:uncharacterized protein LOC129761810 isoform X2 [Toxorhynchites rutilus septentrionalis]|uniref:uncharacterized protein LOC129761810 isoform X2 n=1 Tax=Toxorhynchites rutilus septentrionalis TaxID=329112 RepID=UPI0024791CEE|nr:uncharacterized protein LOC129761810 isoform X2 [Toxorhynchites rutilus septentrionalis]